MVLVQREWETLHCVLYVLYMHVVLQHSTCNLIQKGFNGRLVRGCFVSPDMYYVPFGEREWLGTNCKCQSTL